MILLYPIVKPKKDKPPLRVHLFLISRTGSSFVEYFFLLAKNWRDLISSPSRLARGLQEKVNLHKTRRFIFICRAIHHLPLLLHTRKLTRPENNNPHHGWDLHFFVVYFIFSGCSINQFHSFRAWVVIIFTILSSSGIIKERYRNSGIIGSLEPEGFSKLHSSRPPLFPSPS